MKLGYTKSFYLYLAMGAAALVPVIAQAQQAPDNGDGPQIAAYQDSRPSTQDDNSAEARRRKQQQKKKSDDASAAAPAADASGGTGNAPSAFSIDVQAGNGSGQVVSTNLSGSYKGNGESASITLSGGAGQAGIVQGKIQLDGLRTNDPDPKKGFGGAAFFDGSAQIGTNGTGTAHGVAGGEINGLINLTPTVNCILAGGIGFGGTYSNEMNHDAGATSTIAYGPGAYLGAGCSGAKWDLMLHNNVVVNAAAFSDPTNVTKATSEHKLQANYWLSDSIALTASAKVDVDYRDVKPLADYQLLGGMTFVLGGKGKPSASSSATNAN